MGLLLGLLSHSLKGLHAANQDTGPESANPLDKGTPVLVGAKELLGGLGREGH